jgi:electron transfer flavoprotein alpha subunit
MGTGILVLADHEGGVFKKTAFELVSKAASLGGPVTVLVIGHTGGAELGAYGANKVLTVNGPAFAQYNTLPWVRALQAAVSAVNPAVVLASAGAVGKDALPRLAARLGAGLGTEVTGLRLDGGAVVGRRPMYAGKALADVRVTSSVALFTVRANSFTTPAPGAGVAAVEALEVSLDAADTALVVLEIEGASSAVADLTEADRIVSGGRSVKSVEGFNQLIRPLAATLGATPGASRAAVDAGFAPHSAQVGQTGKTVNPSLYIACGISGAIQHLAGMRTSKVIVAINSDKDAPIFQVATYGIVGDMFEVGPKLAEELKAALSG